MAGANISTRAGEGDANVFDWTNLHRNMQGIMSQELGRQKSKQAMLEKSELEFNKASTAARPEDIPRLTSLYNQFQDAGMKLTDPKVYKDPILLSRYTKQKNEAQLQFLAEANASKETGKTLSALPMEYAKAGGNGWLDIEEFSDRLNKAKGLPTTDIKALHLDTPMAYTAPKDTYPEADYNKHVFGTRKDYKELVPLKENGVTTKWQEKITNKPEYSVPQIIDNTVQALHGVRGVRKAANDRFLTDMQNPNGLVDQRINAAIEEVKKLPAADQEHILPYLQKNPIGYEIAGNIVNGRAEVRDGRVTPDTEYQNGLNRANAMAMTKMRIAASTANNKRSIAASERKFAMKLKVNGQEEDYDTRPMFDAAQNPTQMYTTPQGKKLVGRDVVEAYVQSIAANNPKNISGVTISNWDLMNDQKRRGIYEKLGLSALPEKAKGNFTKEQMQEFVKDDFIKKINDKYGDKGFRINKSDIEKFAIPVFIKRSYTKDVGSSELKENLSISSANPSTNDYGQFHATVSGQAATKKKQQLSLQDDDLGDNFGMYSGDDPILEDASIPAPAPSKFRKAINKVATKTKNFFLK